MLKQKRLYEGQRDQLYNQQFNVEQTSFAMTSMQVGHCNTAPLPRGWSMCLPACLLSVHSCSALLQNARSTRHPSLSLFARWQDTVHTVSAMKAAGKEMKGFMKNNDLKIENIEKLHDEMSDMLVRRASGPWPFGIRDLPGVAPAWARLV